MLMIEMVKRHLEREVASKYDLVATLWCKQQRATDRCNIDPTEAMCFRLVNVANHDCNYTRFK